MPTDTVLDGYTLETQHVIDHEFLLAGSPFSLATPLLLACLILGIGMLAVSAVRKSIVLSVLSMVLISAKYLFLPFNLWVKYSDSQLFGYTWKIYPGYWATETFIILALNLAALAVIVFSIATRKRAPELS